MSRTLLAASLLSLFFLVRHTRAQDSKSPSLPQRGAPQQAAPGQGTQQEAEPPEEDPSFKQRTYDFNPLQASKSINVGNQYFKKGNYSAAKNRYKDATLFDPGSAEAFEKLGEAEEKLHDFAAARDAFAKYLELDPNAKDAESIKKRIEKWPASAPATPSAPKK